MKQNIKILTSSMGLGTYIPSLFLLEYFNDNGHHATIQTIESYFSDQTMKTFIKSKETYHKSYKAALLGHKLAEQKLSSLVGHETMEKIIKDWEDSDSSLFLLLSGNWVQIINEYKKLHPFAKIKIFTIHLDADNTPSWLHFSNQDNLSEDIWLFQKNSVSFMIEHSLKKKEIFDIEYVEKTPYVYIHGGGWGMGTYQDQYVDFMRKLPYPVKTTVHDVAEIAPYPNWQYYLVDSQWKPWEISNERENMYPPLEEIRNDFKRSIDNESHKGMYDLFENCCAIISKPGGGTLLDCLITATPIVFLKPIAKHEAQNQLLWEKLGLGISYEKWEAMNFQMSALEEIYENILSYREKLPYLGEHIINQCKIGQ